MEVVAGIGAGGAGTSIAGGAGAGMAGGSFIGSSDFLTIAQGGMSAASALSSMAGAGREAGGAMVRAENSIMEGRTAFRNYADIATAERLKGMEEFIAGEATVLELRTQLTDTLSQGLVAFSASGTDTTGQAAVLAEEAGRQTRIAEQDARRSAAIRRLQSTMRARQAMAAAYTAKQAGFAGAEAALEDGRSLIDAGAAKGFQDVIGFAWDAAKRG